MNFFGLMGRGHLKVALIYRIQCLFNRFYSNSKKVYLTLDVMKDETKLEEVIQSVKSKMLDICSKFPVYKNLKD